MYFLQFSSVTSAVNNVYNLVTWKGTRKNLAWTILTTPLAIFPVLQCAELQQLQLDAMSEPTTPTLPTSPSLFRKTWQNNLTNKAHVAETSLTISDDLMGCIRTYGASSCSCATSWSFSESRDPDSSTAGCGSLQMSMLRHAATNPPIFNHGCQCFQT
jgi:hypothetical protein